MPAPPNKLHVPADLVLALNLSKDDRTVLDLVASHTWTFTGDAERDLWRTAIAAIDAVPPAAGEPAHHYDALALPLHHQRARTMLRSLDDRGIMLEHMVDDELVASMAKSVCGIAPMPLLTHAGGRARGWLLTAAAMGNPRGEIDHAVWCLGQHARTWAEREIRTYLLHRLDDPSSDLDAVMADIDDCRRALAWLDGEAPTSTQPSAETAEDAA